MNFLPSIECIEFHKSITRLTLDSLDSLDSLVSVFEYENFVQKFQLFHCSGRDEMIAFMLKIFVAAIGMMLVVRYAETKWPK